MAIWPSPQGADGAEHAAVDAVDNAYKTPAMMPREPLAGIDHNIL